MMSMLRLSTEHQQKDPRSGSIIKPSASVCDADISLVDNDRDFSALADEWQVLFCQVARRQQLFQSHSWLRHWCASYVEPGSNDGQRLSIVVLRREGQLRLVLPLLVVRTAGVKILQWMGFPASQYGDVLVAGSEGSEELIAAALRFAIHETGADLVWLRKVRDDAAVRPVLERSGALKVSQCSAPYIDLSSYDNADKYMQQFSANARKQRRRRKRRLQEMGKLEFSFLRPGEEAAAASVEALRLKRETFGQASRLTSVDHCMERFFRNVCGQSAAPVEPVVSKLSLDGEAIAYEIGLIHDKYYAAHVGTFDPRYSQHSPGILQIDETIAACIEEGIQTYDLLAPADDYKLSLTKDHVGVSDYVLCVTPLGKLYKHSIVDFGMPILKQVRDHTIRFMRSRS